jgi:membrane protein YdbS with pleckstrin-like domain
MVEGVTPTLARKIINNIKGKTQIEYKPEPSEPKRMKPFYDMKNVWFIKASLWVLFYIWFIGGWFIMFDFMIGGPVITFSLILITIFFLMLVRFWAGLFHDSYYYQIKDSEIIVEFGVLFKKRTTIPFQRIQNVHVVQGPIMRMYNLKSIQIETAGGSIYRPGPTGTGLSEGQIPAPESPDDLADMIIEKVKRYKAAEGL